MKIKMTDRFIGSVKPNTSKRIEISDTERVGLRLRMSSKGNASWIYQKKIKGGKRRGYKLGTYPQMSLAKARSEALKIQINAEQGIDTIEATKEARRLHEAQKLVKDTLDNYIRNHIDQELKEGQSRDGRKRQLLTYLEPYFSYYLSDLTRTMLQSIIDTKQAEGKIVMANRVRAALRAFTGWAHRRGHVENDVGRALQKAGKEKPRDRTPSLEEVKAIWEASLKMGDLWGPFIRLCILTGQRCRSDILLMKWSWIDFERSCYEIPNPKNGRPHIVHFSGPAMKEILHLQELQTKNPSSFVFTTTGKTAASGVSKAKLQLDLLISEIWHLKGSSSIFEPWVLHDLRRSQATALAEAGFDEGVVDRIQNHVASGSRVSTVAAVYNKAQKLPQRRTALDAWARMVTDEYSNILSFKEA